MKPADKAKTFEAPQGSLIRRELRAIREPFRLGLQSRLLRHAPKGTGGVMVIPGFSANDLFMAPLRAYVRRLGYRTWGWDLGTNRGRVEHNLPRVIEQVERRVAENDGKPIALIGWSLGGVFAREVTRDRPELVTEIITMATPIYGGPRYTVSADNYDETELDQIEDKIDERSPILIDHRITAFYTKRDGAVDWRACIDDINPNVDMIEVDSSHLGIILDPTVWLGIANRLASAELS